MAVVFLAQPTVVLPIDAGTVVALLGEAALVDDPDDTHGAGCDTGGQVVGEDPLDLDLETAYCAEVLAVTYQAMGLLPGRHDPSWYDAGRFWSGGARVG